MSAAARVPIFVDGDLAVSDLARILASVGYHIHSDSAGRLCASRVPAFLRRDVVKLAASADAPPVRLLKRGAK